MLGGTSYQATTVAGHCVWSVCRDWYAIWQHRWQQWIRQTSAYMGSWTRFLTWFAHLRKYQLDGFLEQLISSMESSRISVTGAWPSLRYLCFRGSRLAVERCVLDFVFWPRIMLPIIEHNKAVNTTSLCRVVLCFS